MDIFRLRSRFALILAVLIAPFAGVSAAGLIDSATGAVSRPAAVDVGASTDVRTQINNQSGSVRAGVQASSSDDVNDDSSAQNNGNAFGNNSNASASVTTGRYGSVDVNAGNSGNVIHIDRSANDVTSATSARLAANAVATQSDLRTYAATEMRDDANFNSLDVADDHVDVGYKQPARFLGFIPMSVNVHVTVDQNGQVDVSYPWYSFLTLTDRSDLETALQNEISAFFATHGNASLSTTTASTTAMGSATSTVSSTTPASGQVNMSGSTVLTPSEQASLIARIVAVLKSHLTNMSGTASTTQSM